MDPGIITIVLFGFMLVLLASGLWIAISLIAVGFLALEIFSSAPAGSLLPTTVWDASWNWALTALPLFIWTQSIQKVLWFHANWLIRILRLVRKAITLQFRISLRGPFQTWPGVTAKKQPRQSESLSR